jgi:hypothetical protein
MDRAGAASRPSLFGNQVYQHPRQLIADSVNGGNETVNREWQVGKGMESIPAVRWAIMLAKLARIALARQAGVAVSIL